MPPLSKEDASKLIKRRHPEWGEFQRRWRWLQDSYEGGNRYRYANYVHDPLSGSSAEPWYMGSASRGDPGPGSLGSIDPTTGVHRGVFYGVVAEVNLIPHISETAPEGYNIYAMRLERTPVPTILPRAVKRHLSRIFSREVSRTGTDSLETWWKDVDGTGTPMDKYVRKVVGPLLLTLGQLDLCFDHPAPPAGVTVASRAEMKRYGLDRCILSYVLPENMLDWTLDPVTKRYTECLVFERTHQGPRFRHWTDTESNAYLPSGEFIREASREHPFGRPPLVRVFDERKLRCENTGQSRYEPVAELQREIYNKKSELILADVHSSHPTLQGPEEFLGKDNTIPVGPGKILPKKKDMGANGNTTYEGWDYVEAKMTGVASIREHAQDMEDEADREAALLKPAGMTKRSTTSQSGISKQMDERDGNDYLSEISQTLADAEIVASREYLNVAADGKPSAADLDAIAIVYPKQFDLSTTGDLMEFLTGLQAIAVDGGLLPLVEAEACKRMIRVTFVGASDEDMALWDAEIDAHFADLAARHEQQSEAAAATGPIPLTPLPGLPSIAPAGVTTEVPQPYSADNPTIQPA